MPLTKETKPQKAQMRKAREGRKYSSKWREQNKRGMHEKVVIQRQVHPAQAGEADRVLKESQRRHVIDDDSESQEVHWEPLYDSPLY